MLKDLFAPGWPRIFPGLILCILFGWTAMNVDHTLSKYYHANVAIQNLPQLDTMDNTKLLVFIKMNGMKAKSKSPENEKAFKTLKKIKSQEIAPKELQNLIVDNDAKNIVRTTMTTWLDKANATPDDNYNWAEFLYLKLQLKYVAILLIGGILIRNLIKIPEIFLPGINIARPIIKPGIIILGVHYVWSDVLKVGGVGLLLTSIFIMGAAFGVMFYAKKKGIHDGLAGILANGIGICGVSAIIATAPVVKSKPRDMAYAIGTILLFGTVMLFLFPYVGDALDLSQPQFGAWCAIAILNTAQLLAASEWYGVGARDTAILINAARIMFIPIMVLCSLWFYVIREAGGESKETHVSKWKILKDKFPVFILGFFIMVLLNSFHLIGGPKDAHTTAWAMDTVYKWFFAVGFAGIGLSINIQDMKKAGGKAFAIGFNAAILKAVLGLLAVYLIGAGLLTVGSG
jgi:uncharacterized integral membrane protein (TIGR00698 family)